MAESDITFLVGLGYLADAARAAGAKKVRLAPHSYDSVRFDQPWNPPRQRPLDAVMIANLHNIKRIPGLYLPGGRQRKQLGRAFHQHLGDRFAAYGGGSGWKGEAYARGPIRFDQQSDMIRSAWMSVAWDHFDDLPMYSSDRLPISLACGVPHLTNYQRGYEPGFWRHSRACTGFIRRKRLSILRFTCFPCRWTGASIWDWQPQNICESIFMRTWSMATFFN